MSSTTTERFRQEMSSEGSIDSEIDSLLEEVEEKRKFITVDEPEVETLVFDEKPQPLTTQDVSSESITERASLEDSSEETEPEVGGDRRRVRLKGSRERAS